MSVFEPYPMRDTVQHFCEKHLDKIKAYMESLSGLATMSISVSLLFVKKSLICLEGTQLHPHLTLLNRVYSGEKIMIPNHSKVKISQSEVQIEVSIL